MNNKMFALITILLILSIKTIPAQIVANTAKWYDSSCIIKTADYWDSNFKRKTNSTFIMQKSGMQELDKYGGMFGCGLLPDKNKIILGDFEYTVWATYDGVLFVLIKDLTSCSYTFRRLFSKQEETYKVVSVEYKIDKIYKISVGLYKEP